MEVKKCTHCLEVQPIENFHKRKVGKSGKVVPREHCKPCRALKAKVYHKVKDKQQHTLNGIRGRAAKHGLPFDLEYGDITPPEFCPVLGFELERYSGGAKPNSPSVDRIKPELGYVKTNIQIISLKANMMKHNATQEELERFAKWVLAQKY